MSLAADIARYYGQDKEDKNGAGERQTLIKLRLQGEK